MTGFVHATSLDFNMGYYPIWLDGDAQKIYAIILPWSKYSYLHLPMGIPGSPGTFQEKIYSLMETLEYVKVYQDDLLTIKKSTYKDDLTKLHNVLICLQDANLCVKITKSFFPSCP